MTLIGATTENPSFEVVAPLLSRCRVFTLRRLERRRPRGAAPGRRARRASAGSAASGVALPDAAAGTIAEAADGDARRALGILETAVALARRAGAQGGRRRGPPRGGGPARAPLRPRPRAALRRDLGLHQEPARERPRRRALLARAHARGRRGPALRRAPPRDLRLRGRRATRSPRASPSRPRPTSRSSASACPRAASRSPTRTTFLACAPKSNASYAALGRAEEAARSARLAARPAPPAQRADAAAARARLRARLPLPPRRARRLRRGARTCPTALGDARFYEPTERGAERAIAERLRAWRRRRDEP